MSEIVIGKSSGRNVSIDVDLLLRTRALIEGNSGSGKSWLLRRLLEQLFGKVQQIVIDSEGEFATLREKYGFVLAGKGGETPADPRSAALLAHKLLELGASAVIDLYEMREQDRHAFVRLFLDAMIDAPKSLWHPVVVAIDEIHRFCPEKGAGESEASDSVISLATRGRKRGYCLIGATQRLGKFRKDAAAELLNVLVGMTFIDIDRKRAAEQLGIPREDLRAFFDEMKLLEAGRFYGLGRAISRDRVLIEVGPVETTHPELGSSKHAAEPPPAPEKIKALLPKLADLPKAAEEKAKTEADLRTEIRSLKAQLAARPRDVQEKTVTVEKRVEVPVITDHQAKRLVDAADKFEKIVAKIDGSVREMAVALSKARNNGAAARGMERESKPVPQRAARAAPVSMAPSPAVAAPAGDTTLDKAQRRVLSVLAQFPEGCEIGKLALLSIYRVSGGFRNILSSLRTAGFMEGENTGVMRITDSGIAALGAFESLPPPGPELAAHWLAHGSLGGTERKVLQELLARPDGATIDELAEAVGLKVSGGFRNVLSVLRTAGVLVGKNTGQMRPHEDLVA